MVTGVTGSGIDGKPGTRGMGQVGGLQNKGADTSETRRGLSVLNRIQKPGERACKVLIRVSVEGEGSAHVQAL